MIGKKDADYWKARGYSFKELRDCPACKEPVEVWLSRGQEVFLNLYTFDSHFAGCVRARQYRIEIQKEQGAL